MNTTTTTSDPFDREGFPAVFTTRSGVTCTAETAAGGCRLYKPIHADWMRRAHDLETAAALSAWPSRPAKV